MTTLIIARHGNTFEKGQTPTRVGGRTDLPLTEKGLQQGTAIGEYLKGKGLIPDVVYASTLQRTQQTAKAAIKALGAPQPIFPLKIFDEIDYGPDENQPEDAVIARIGEAAIKAWDADALPPPGWDVDPAQIIQNWQGFARQITEDGEGETVLVVTSNGIARFAPHLTGDFDGFADQHDIKLPTGALGVLQYTDSQWIVLEWGARP